MHSILRHTLALMGALIACSIAAAQDGTTAYQFLNVPVSSHVYALGGHNLTIIDDDINLVEQNPALLGKEFDHQVGLNYMRYIGSTNFMGARYGQGIGEHGALGVGIQYYGYGKMNAADASGVITGTFNASDMAFTLTYSHDISENLRGGINLKYVYSSYETYSAGAIAADLGINYYNPDKDLSLSLVAKNLGGQVKKFNDKRDKLPWDIQALLRARRQKQYFQRTGGEGEVCEQPVQAPGLWRGILAHRPHLHRCRIQLQDSHRHEHL